MRGLRAIDRKLLRDFRRLWAQALAIALVLAAGVSVMLMSLGMSRALDDTRAAFYERNRFADVFAQVNRAPLSLMPEIRAIDGVYAAEPRIQSLVLLDLPGRVEAAQAWIQSIPDDGTPLLNVPTLRSGDWPGIEARDQVVVNEPFAEANGYAIGDTFAVLLDGQKRTVTIVGTVLSPEYVYTIGPGQMMPDNRNMGVIWMRERALAAAFDMTGAFNSVSLLLVPGTPVERVIDDLERILAPYGNDGANGRETQISHSFLDGEIKQLRTLSYILPPVFMGITVFLVNMVIGRIVALERAEIGLMKAIGYSDLTICLHYLMLAGLIAVVGVAIGWGVGTWLARAMAEMYADFFKFPYLIFAMGKDVYVLSALIAFAAAFAGSMRAALSAARLPPAVAMTPPAPPRFKRTWIDEAMAALRLSQPTVMIMRSVVRWPLRSAMTILGIALAVAVLVASNFAGDATDVIIDSAFHQQNRQDVILILGGDRPEIAVEDARRLPGVMMVEGEMFLGATIRNGPVSKDSAIQARRPGTDLSRMVDAPLGRPGHLRHPRRRACHAVFRDGRAHGPRRAERALPAGAAGHDDQPADRCKPDRGLPRRTEGHAVRPRYHHDDAEPPRISGHDRHEPSDDDDRLRGARHPDHRGRRLQRRAGAAVRTRAGTCEPPHPRLLEGRGVLHPCRRDDASGASGATARLVAGLGRGLADHEQLHLGPLCHTPDPEP